MGGSSSVLSASDPNSSHHPSNRKSYEFKEYDEERDEIRPIDDELLKYRNFDGRNPLDNYYDVKMLQNIVFLPLRRLKQIRKIPKFHENKDLFISLNDFIGDLYENSVFIFISYSFKKLRTDEDIYYQLVMNGIDRLEDSLFNNPQYSMKERKDHLFQFYVWFDYGCSSSFPEPSPHLSKIIEICDFIFTPIYDPNPLRWSYDTHSSKELPFSWFEKYQSKEFQEVYLQNSWNRLEMLYAATLPLLPIQKEKRKRFPFYQHNNKNLSTSSSSKRNNIPKRPHILYGSKEDQSSPNSLYPFIVLPPLLHSYLENYHPLRAENFFPSSRTCSKQSSSAATDPNQLSIALNSIILQESIGSSRSRSRSASYEIFNDDESFQRELQRSQEEENDRFRNTIVQALRSIESLIKQEKRSLAIGYVGERQHGVRHGHGKSTYDNGDIYEGSWFDANKHGYGRYCQSNGECYEGHWDNGYLSEKVIYTSISGRQFIFEFESFDARSKYSLICSPRLLPVDERISIPSSSNPRASSSHESGYDSKNQYDDDHNREYYDTKFDV